MSNPTTSTEQVFYLSSKVQVTYSRLVAHGQTFSMANISSVKIRTQNPNRGLPIMLLSVGAVLMIIDSIGVRLLGAALAVTAIALFVIAKSSHFLVLTTAGGEVRALRSRDLNRVQAVLNAINEAIVARA